VYWDGGLFAAPRAGDLNFAASVVDEYDFDEQTIW
jgi:hypothetical protein